MQRIGSFSSLPFPSWNPLRFSACVPLVKRKGNEGKEAPIITHTRPCLLAKCAPRLPPHAACAHTHSRYPPASPASHPRSDKKAAGQARKAAAKDAVKDKEESARAAVEDVEWEAGGKKANKKQEADAAKKTAKSDRKADADAQVR